MNHFLKLSCLLLGLMTWWPVALHAAPARKSVAAFIESSRRSKGVLVNSPRYDKNAKVFFLHYLGYNMHQNDKLEAATRPLVPVYKEISGSGAELIIYLDFPPEQQGEGRKDKSKGNKARGSGSQGIKCPVVNIFESKAREALFKKDARGKEYSYGTYDLRAVDADGVPLAYFSLDNGSIVMRDAETGETKTIGSGSYTGNAWIGPAIQASCKDMLAKADPESSQAESDDDKRKQKKKARKKSTRKRKGDSM